MPESKKMFLKSLNALVDAKEETIENLQGLIETVCQTESLDAEQEQLEQEYRDIQTELSPLHADAKKLWAIHYNIYEVQHEQKRQNAATRQKKQEIEH